MKVKGIVFTVLSALLFGFTPVLASKTYEMGSTPETLTFYRNLLVIPVVFLIMLVQRTRFRISPKLLGYIVLFGVLGRGMTTLMLYSSYQYVGIGTATTLHFLYPVFVALICRFFYREKLGAAKVAALVVASIGIVFFIDRGQSAAALGILLSVASGLTYAFYMVGMDKKGLKDMSPYQVSFYMAIAVAAGMLLYNLPTQKIVFALPPKAFLYTFIIAMCTSFLAVIFLQIGIKHLSATTAAIFCLFEPIASSVSGWLFLGESLSAAKILGSAVILAAVAILMIAKQKPSQEKAVSAAPAGKKEEEAV